MQAVDALASVHALDWRRQLADWSPPLSAPGAVRYWDRIVERAAEPDWTTMATRIRDLLIDTAPPSCHTGIFHGDYQTNNVLFDETGDLIGIVDWEISGIGPTGVDLAWLAMWSDPTCWHPDFGSTMRVRVEAEALVNRYAATSGRPIESWTWYRALACYIFAVIVGFNTRLHRTGRRVDPWYEVLAPSVPVLHDRAQYFLHSPDQGL
jgi:aminoglycoside phosphotransferase (APT) family kinase protein